MEENLKQVLLKDLCARLPYGVKVYDTKSSANVPYMNLCHVNGIVNEVFISSGMICRTASIEDIKPYLFPISSMTEEQKRELSNICKCLIHFTDWEIYFPNYEDNNMGNWQKIVSWMYKNHYDINGLIEKGLAIDASGLNIKIY